MLLAAACGTSNLASRSVDWSAQTSADAGGGMSALVQAARAEGGLNVIALPAGWAGYGAIIDGFQARYGIRITSADPQGSGQQAVDAIKQLGGTGRAPDVVDVGMAVALANTNLFAPYRVETWGDIPESQKEPTGLWFQDHGGFMSIGYDSRQVPQITSLEDLVGAAFKGKVALTGDPRQTDTALNGVMMASLAHGGSLDDISKGVDFFHQLRQKDDLSAIEATSATVKDGATPVVFDWDDRSAAYGVNLPGWKVFVPRNAVLGGFYAQAVSKTAPHPAAARLWEEYLYSDEGQNLWLKGGERPVRMAAMEKSGTLDSAAAAALPAVAATPVFLSADQAAAAKRYLAAHWAAAVG